MTNNFSANLISVDKIQRDPYQPRSTFKQDLEEEKKSKTKSEKNDASIKRLFSSIKERGILDPIKVIQIDSDRYQVVDGHRRLFCAKQLNYKEIPCIILQQKKSDHAELERSRFELQTNVRQWKPLERANVFNRIKTIKNFKSNSEVAKFLGISDVVVTNSMHLRDQNIDDLRLMEKYDLNDTFRVEFIRLKERMRKIKSLEAIDITEILFEKVKNNVIKNAKDFRKLGRIFLRASVNENEIYKFLSEPDMTIKELEYKTIKSGLSGQIEELGRDAAEKAKNDALQEKEIELICHLIDSLSCIPAIKERRKKMKVKL